MLMLILPEWGFENSNSGPRYYEKATFISTHTSISRKTTHIHKLPTSPKQPLQPSCKVTPTILFLNPTPPVILPRTNKHLFRICRHNAIKRSLMVNFQAFRHRCTGTRWRGTCFYRWKRRGTGWFRRWFCREAPTQRDLCYLVGENAS